MYRSRVEHRTEAVSARRRMRAALLGSTALAAAIGLAACAGAPAGEVDTGELAHVKMNVWPSTDLLAVYVGLEDGTFEEHGIDLEIETVPDQSALVASITTGEAMFATLGTTIGATAVLQDVPICMVSRYSNAPIEGAQEVLVRADSGIETWADLAGKTVGTAGLRAGHELAVRNALRASGADPEDVSVELVFGPDAIGAVKSGRVDAVLVLDPFLTPGLEDPELRSLGNAHAETPYRMPGGGIFASRAGAEENAEVIQRFLDALTDVSERVQADPELARAVIPTALDIDASLAATMGLPDFVTGLDEDGFDDTLADMVGYGWIDRAPTASEVLCPAVDAS